jgi:hypothetical protein
MFFDTDPLILWLGSSKSMLSLLEIMFVLLVSVFLEAKNIFWKFPVSFGHRKSIFDFGKCMADLESLFSEIIPFPL